MTLGRVQHLPEMVKMLHGQALTTLHSYAHLKHLLAQ